MNINKNTMKKALKWSTITEVGTKIISPITNMILARILAPEAFGVVATIYMITSFADIFTDAGFQKYIIQHDFKDEKELDIATNVAFWSNLLLSLVLWMVISVLSKQISILVGNEGCEKAIIIACISLPLTSFSSIQGARFKRELKFKPIFKVRITAAIIPLIVTIPLALLGCNYWSLIAGTIVGNMYNALALSIISDWKPKFTYSFLSLRNILSYSCWTLMDSIAVWLTTWLDAFIIGRVLQDYYLGLYKNSLSMVNSLIAIITSSLSPVLFSSLSRQQNNKDQMVSSFLNAQRLLAMIMIPLGIGIFLYKELATQLLFGTKWSEASNIIGAWALSSVFRTCFVSINSELYRASGNPKTPLYLQLIDLAIILPTCIISIRYGFWFLVYTRAIIRLDLILPNIYVLSKYYNVNIIKVYSNFVPYILSAIIMSILSLALRLIADSIVFELLSIIICCFTYFISLMMFNKPRNEIKEFLKSILTSISINKSE